jgi:hypothetical protein
MKKMKIIMVSIVIISAISIAWASKPSCSLCEYAQQYYKVGSSYVEAGIYGDNYICWNIAGNTCTYWRPDPVNQPNYYAPCRSGVYQGE